VAPRFFENCFQNARAPGNAPVGGNGVGVGVGDEDGDGDAVGKPEADGAGDESWDDA
jgi:hypothetical protein